MTQHSLKICKYHYLYTKLLFNLPSSISFARLFCFLKNTGILHICRADNLVKSNSTDSPHRWLTSQKENLMQQY